MSGKFWHEYHDCDIERCREGANGVYTCGWSFERQAQADLEALGQGVGALCGKLADNYGALGEPPREYPEPPADLVLRPQFELPRTRRKRDAAWQQWEREHWGTKENGQ